MIARAFMHEPKLLILDEPTAGVDIEIRYSMWEFLQHMNAAGTTIILTTHYLEEVEKLCNHVAFIHHGQVVLNAPLNEVLNKFTHHVCVLDVKDPVLVSKPLPAYVRVVAPQKLEVSMPSEISFNQLFMELGGHGIEVVGMREKTNRIEELFLSLTKPQ
jgi:ABC-2 type transport system ATP-binding protein